MAATAVGVYCASRLRAADIGMRSDVVKLSVEDMTRRLATGTLPVVKPSLSAFAASCQLVSPALMSLITILEFCNLNVYSIICCE
ncbi:NC domain-containing protein-like protein [Actinidia rufa]|uniref:NC domain-containing protein-like protein n=1 Tax=Actinidia rufa TaxID=165716 RepID=A0A7J0D8X8_9ERIC|nr:NC domain-containing protein-like protein [Actinidia rufa]